VGPLLGKKTARPLRNCGRLEREQGSPSETSAVGAEGTAIRSYLTNRLAFSWDGNGRTPSIEKLERVQRGRTTEGNGNGNLCVRKTMGCRGRGILHSYISVVRAGGRGGLETVISAVSQEHLDAEERMDGGGERNLGQRDPPRKRGGDSNKVSGIHRDLAGTGSKTSKRTLGREGGSKTMSAAKKAAVLPQQGSRGGTWYLSQRIVDAGPIKELAGSQKRISLLKRYR